MPSGVYKRTKKCNVAHSGWCHSEKIKKRMSEMRTGNKHPNWKGRTKSQQGYWLIKMPEHPNSDCRGYITQSNLIMEKKIGRYLRRGEIVHHKNKIKTDDRIENLMLFSNGSEHQKYHLAMRYN